MVVNLAQGRKVRKKTMFNRMKSAADLVGNRSWWKYQWRYLRGATPWDTRITPPEVMQFIAVTLPGRALDLGCGTGTNAITLTRHGWEVTGVDFIAGAIWAAQRKSRRAGLRIDFHCADVTRLDMLVQPYDYLLDIGCLISLPAAARPAYARTATRLLNPGGWYMLYGWLPRRFEGRLVGISPKQVESLLGRAFVKSKTVIGEEKGKPSAWHWFRKR